MASSSCAEPHEDRTFDIMAGHSVDSAGLEAAGGASTMSPSLDLKCMGWGCPPRHVTGPESYSAEVEEKAPEEL